MHGHLKITIHTCWVEQQGHCIPLVALQEYGCAPWVFDGNKQSDRGLIPLDQVLVQNEHSCVELEKAEEVRRPHGLAEGTTPGLTRLSVWNQSCTVGCVLVDFSRPLADYRC